MIFLHAENLLAKPNEVRAERIENGGSAAIAVVNGVDDARCIAIRKDMIQPGIAEILPDRLQGAAEILLDTVQTRNLDIW